jgi:hypothetical protein
MEAKPIEREPELSMYEQQLKKLMDSSQKPKRQVKKSLKRQLIEKVNDRQFRTKALLNLLQVDLNKIPSFTNPSEVKIGGTRKSKARKSTRKSKARKSTRKSRKSTRKRKSKVRASTRKRKSASTRK